MQIGDKFKLIGRSTVFIAVKTYDAAGFIPSVAGRTLDGKYQTTARIADIEMINPA